MPSALAKFEKVRFTQNIALRYLINSNSFMTLTVVAQNGTEHSSSALHNSDSVT